MQILGLEPLFINTVYLPLFKAVSRQLSCQSKLLGLEALLCAEGVSLSGGLGGRLP